MVLSNTVAKGIQEYSDHKKQHEFFVVDRIPASSKKSIRIKEVEWLQLCKILNLPLTDSMREKSDMQGEVFVMNFSNGLSIIDNGKQVFFNATKTKENVIKNTENLASALSVIGCAANHLYREMGTEPYISTNREGSGEMVKTFKKSCLEARKMVNQELIAKLQSPKNTLA